MEKFQAIKRASILGMLGNLFLLLIKGIVGFLTNSQSMIADAFNSAGDIFSSIMTFIGNRIASRPRDQDHHLGHGKAEYIYSMFISIAMAILAIEVFKSSMTSLFFGNHYVFSIWLVFVCIITIFVKLFLYLYTHKLSQKYKNLLLEANAKDHRNDCVITFFNLVACLLSLGGVMVIDSLVGMLIGLWIFLSAFKIFLESYHVLMDKAMDEATEKQVLELVKSHQEVLRVNHFNATPVGYRYQISFTIFVDGNLSTFKSHEIANHLEKEIAQKIPEIYLTVIHVNPQKVETKSKD